MSTKHRIDAAWAKWTSSLGDRGTEHLLDAIRRDPPTRDRMREAFEAGYRASRRANAGAAALAIEHGGKDASEPSAS